MFDHHDRKRNDDFFARMEHIKNEALEEEAHEAKQQALEDIAYQKEQLEKLEKANTFYRLAYKSWSVIKDILTLLHDTVGKLATILPPLNAFIKGTFFVIELVEAIFISKEVRNTKTVKIINSAIGTGLTIAGTILIFNPVTAPLGAMLFAGAMFIATITDGFFWYKASKNLKTTKAELAHVKHDINHHIHEFLESHCKEEIKQVSDLHHQIDALEKHEINLTPNDRIKLESLKQSKATLINKINYSVNSQENILTLRQKFKNLNNNIVTERKIRNEKRKNFFLSAASFIGTALLAISAVLVAAAVLSNPISLGIAGTVILGITTFVAVKSKYFPAKPAIEKSVAIVSLEAKKENLHSEHISDTEHIVHRLGKKLV